MNFIFFAGILCSCANNGQKENVAKIEDSVYSKIDIYCWCLYTTTEPVEHTKPVEHYTHTWDNCTTGVSITSADLIEPDNLFESISDPTTIDAMGKLFFGEKIVADPSQLRSEPRFLILFRKANLATDTILYTQGDNRKFIYNEKVYGRTHLMSWIR